MFYFWLNILLQNKYRKIEKYFYENILHVFMKIFYMETNGALISSNSSMPYLMLQKFGVMDWKIIWLRRLGMGLEMRHLSNFFFKENASNNEICRQVNKILSYQASGLNSKLFLITLDLKEVN